MQSKSGGFREGFILLNDVARQRHLQVVLLDSPFAIGALLDQKKLEGLTIKPKQSTIHADVHAAKIQGWCQLYT